MEARYWCLCNTCLVLNKDLEPKDIPLLKEGVCANHRSKHKCRFAQLTRVGCVAPATTLKLPGFLSDGTTNDYRQLYTDWLKKHAQERPDGQIQAGMWLSMPFDFVTACFCCMLVSVPQQT